MAYCEDIYILGEDWREHSIHFKGHYGKKGEAAFEKKKATPEQIKRQNQRNRINGLRRVLRANFHEGDYFLTIKYKRGARPGVERFRKDFKNFRNKLGRLYKKAGVPMKFVYRMEIGKNGGAHIHMVLNKTEGITLADIQSKWSEGRINAQALYSDGGFADLAEYMLKEPAWTENQQISIFMEHGDRMWAYNTSRNLVRPEPVRKKYKRRTVEKMILEGIRAKKGYRVIPDSVHYGVNPFTGMTFLQYTEQRIRGKADLNCHKPPDSEGEKVKQNRYARVLSTF